MAVVPWCKLGGDFHSSPLPVLLSNEFPQLSELEAAGAIAKLWSWCTLHAQDGDLSVFSGVEIAHACGVDIQSQRDADGSFFYEALLSAGIIERVDDSLLLHCPTVTADHAMGSDV